MSDPSSGGYALVKGELISYEYEVSAPNQLTNIQRSIMKSMPTTPIAGDTILFIDYIIIAGSGQLVDSDADDNTIIDNAFISHPRSDIDQIYNQIRLRYGDRSDQEIYIEDKQSIEKYGRRLLEQTCLLYTSPSPRD